QCSRELTKLITSHIQNNNGSIGFDRYMGMALYEPGLGYYSAGARKFGPQGDFTTAPEVSPLFSWCLARQCLEVFEVTGGDRILELGAGSGKMACDLLSELMRLDALPVEYLILETSADLKQRQYQLLKERQPDVLDRVKWLDTLPSDRIDGVVLANEVLDAVPVHKISITNKKISELRVTQQDGGFTWIKADISDDKFISLANERLLDALDSIEGEYQTEINLMIGPFLRSISEILATGAAFFIDYGYSRHEYYHPQRTTGTLVCHYRHRSHDNPFILIGCQDITAFVDFTTVAEFAHEVGMDVPGYSPQAAFLMSCGIEDAMNTYRNDDEIWNLKLSQQAGQLMLPAGMGEKFKVMGLTRNISAPLKGFSTGNSVHKL
ncbi:MAG: SAM-dependent methyltransferase, partial [Gammaproteobacteria bacterium]|nr:SAM-dependent methyltransferase [Gammaproteobacteria bacterium]